MVKFTNNENIPLPLAVWLAHSDYDFKGERYKISATSLLKSTRQFILAARVPLDERVNDISDFIASTYGSAMHDSIEKAWKKGRGPALKKLGYSDRQIDRIRINPEKVEPNTIPIFIERRKERKLGKWTISGKLDMCMEGRLNDFKSTSVYAHILGSKDQDYIRQGSIYRWIHDDIVTDDVIQIQHIFTDWSRGKSKQQKDYPPSRLMDYTLPLMSLEETEQFIGNKLNEIEHFFDKPEHELPYCTDVELWRSDPQYKYYANPEKMGRATKVFDTEADAIAEKQSRGKGVVITIPGEVRACGYCPAFNYCSQKDGLNHA